MLTAHKELAAVPVSVGAARGFVSAVLDAWDQSQLHGDAEVVVSELVTNAIQHGVGAVRVTLELRDRSVRLGVADDSRRPPLRRPAGADGGYGLALVQRLSTHFRTETIPDDGKIVWCECRRPAAQDADSD
jgi:anti-sigma regulatory factor (Ser/Thr protein kinase)